MGKVKNVTTTERGSTDARWVRWENTIDLTRDDPPEFSREDVGREKDRQWFNGSLSLRAFERINARRFTPSFMQVARQKLISLLVAVVMPCWLKAVEADVPPALEAARVSEAPKIDGVLDDPVWEQAAVVDGLTQQFPKPQSPPTEKTIIRVCFDDRQLYIAFQCLDSEPDKINASVLQRDQRISPDDFAYVLLDPFLTGREGYYFRLNSLGSRGDGRVTPQSSRVQMDWDTIWEGAGSLQKDGWSCEFAIPFRSLNFDPNASQWGINFGRWIPRKQERNRWTAAVLNRSWMKLEDAGHLTGLTDLKRGLGLELKPYTVGRWQEGRAGDGIELEAGGDVFYQVTPSLTATVTVNTDFAETEVDNRQVNLSRFPLFFPEKRAFFLEGSEFFEFGDRSTSALPFHSRNIGLSARRELVDVITGVKVVGREGPWGIGLLGVALDDAPGLDSDEVVATRMTYDVLDDSRVGGIFTYGDPRGNQQNWVTGIDFAYKNRNFIGDNLLNVDVHELMSTDPGQQAHAFGIDITYPNEPLRLFLDLKQIDQDFRPGAGFVRRPGTRQYYGGGRWRQYPEQYDWLRLYSIYWSGYVATELDNQVQTEEWEGPGLHLENPRGDEFFIQPEFAREVIDSDFEITEGVVIPAGDYRFGHVLAGFETTSARPVSVEVFGRYGSYWNGTRFRGDVEISWRASKYFGLDLDWRWSDIQLPTGHFDVSIFSLGYRVTPNPNLAWNTVVQFDNVSDEIGVNSRIRYIMKPGNDLFLVFNKSLEYERAQLRSLATETIAKVGLTFRF